VSGLQLACVEDALCQREQSDVASAALPAEGCERLVLGESVTGHEDPDGHADPSVAGQRLIQVRGARLRRGESPAQPRVVMGGGPRAEFAPQFGSAGDKDVSLLLRPCRTSIAARTQSASAAVSTGA
jgi:hypothetical protein